MRIFILLGLLFGVFSSKVEIIVEDGQIQGNYTYVPILADNTIKVDTVSPFTAGGAVSVGGLSITSGTASGAFSGTHTFTSGTSNVNSGATLNVVSGGTFSTASGSTTTFKNQPEFQNNLVIDSPTAVTSGAAGVKVQLKVADNVFGSSTYTQIVTIPNAGSANPNLSTLLFDPTGLVWGPITPIFSGIQLGTGGSILDTYTVLTTAGSQSMSCTAGCANPMSYRYSRLGKQVTLHLEPYSENCGGGQMQWQLPTALWTAGDTTTEIQSLIVGIGVSGNVIAEVHLSSGSLFLIFVVGINAASGVVTWGTITGNCGLRATTITYFVT